ncbi:hypothetical protein [Epibacterium ulvae]|uniref:hypothetical protein n=1 Tax=Epibacterium ulvae TaxID=1156985 RepID=UPI0024928EEA|nr:hypothetical protein [Epibacterium ulvae]
MRPDFVSDELDPKPDFAGCVFMKKHEWPDPEAPTTWCALARRIAIDLAKWIAVAAGLYLAWTLFHVARLMVEIY